MRKIIVLIMCAVMLVSITACGKNSKQTEAEESTPPIESEIAENEASSQSAEQERGNAETQSKDEAPAMITEDTGEYAKENVVRYTRNRDGSFKCSSPQRMEQFSLNMEMGVEDELLVIEYSEGGYIIRTELIGDGEETYAVRSMGFVQDNGEPQEFKFKLISCAESDGKYTFTGADGSKFTIPAE